MKNKLHILYTAAEAAPYSKAGGLADVAGSLPPSLVQSGCRLSVISPLYGSIDRSRQKLTGPVFKDQVSLGSDVQPFAVYQAFARNVTWIFISNEYFFSRPGIYTTADGIGFHDNTARYIFFQKAILACIMKGYLKADILHVNDHHTALLPWMLKNRGIKIPTLLTIHNCMYQGQFTDDESRLLDTCDRDFMVSGSLNRNALDIGMRYADSINTVSRTYRDELVSRPELSYGLHPTILKIKDRFTGILNGADYQYWNPEQDRMIAENYSVNSISRKEKNKLQLLNTAGLPADAAKPLLGSISRQVESKGFFLILDIMEKLIKLDCLFVFLGTGDIRIMTMLGKMAEKYPNQVAVVQEYNEGLAHQIEAGADMFLMPSEYEPCGLNQIYSLKYGTPPIVHKTGGLADTVIRWDGQTGNGFVFDDYSSAALFNETERALTVFQMADWKKIIRNAMTADFSWDQSAKQYLSLYNSILSMGTK